MIRPSEDIDIEFIEPEGGFDPNRLSLALRMLISEKDFIDFFTSKDSSETTRASRKSAPRKTG